MFFAPMDTSLDYLVRTESASRHLFDAADTYQQVLRDTPLPVTVSDVSENDAVESRNLSRWFEKNREAIEKRREAERKYFAESFALGVLCGSILQVAAMGIQLFSGNTTVPTRYQDIIKPGSKDARFCIGRSVRSVPLGLVILAGRNQYNHINAEKLREPNLRIFDDLSLNWPGSTGDGRKDPAFDLKNDRLINYASNIVALMGWNNYVAYRTDMEALLLRM